MTTTKPGTVTCDTCGQDHPATYSHQGRWNEGAIYAVVCDDGLTDYYTAERVSLPTAAVKLVHTDGPVAVVRSQEPAAMPVWTIHVHGRAPIYVALKWAEAKTVADYHAANAVSA